MNDSRTATAPTFPSAVAHGGTLYTSGLAAIDVATMRPSSPDFDSQCAAVLAQLDALLREHDSYRSDVIKLECFLADRAHFTAWNAAFAEYFLGTSTPLGSAAGVASAPARTTTITTLPVDGLLIEIQAVARTPRETP